MMTLIDDALLAAMVGHHHLASASEILIMGDGELDTRIRQLGFRGRSTTFPTMQTTHADLAIAIDAGGELVCDVESMSACNHALRIGGVLIVTTTQFDETLWEKVLWASTQSGFAVRKTNMTALARPVAEGRMLNHVLAPGTTAEQRQSAKNVLRGIAQKTFAYHLFEFLKIC